MEELVQDPGDCVYAVFVGDGCQTFDPLALTVIRKASLPCGDNFTFEFAIIGESHYVEFSDGDGTPIFVEMLACVNLEELGFEADMLNQDVCSPQVLEFGSEKARVNTQTEFTYGHELPAWVENPSPWSELFIGGASARLSFAFPGELRPRTIVEVKVHQTDFGAVAAMITTLHEYVVDGRLMRLATQTNFIHHVTEGSNE